MIVDAHAHIFPEVRGRTAAGPTRGLGHGRVAMGQETITLLPPYGERTIFTPEMLIANLDWAGVDKAVLLQGSFYGEHNAYVSAALRKYPSRLVGAAYFDPWEEGDRRALFKELTADREFRALKLECSEITGLFGLHPEASLDLPETSWLWQSLERLGLVLVLDLGAVGSRSYQTSAVRAIAQNHPGLKIVIAHLAQPRPDMERDAELREQWTEQIDLGKLPNVWFDCAALPAYLPQENFPYPSAGKYLRAAIERLGPDKVMWGSDQPGLLSVASLPQLAKMARLHTVFLSPRQQEMFLWENAGHVFGF